MWLTLFLGSLQKEKKKKKITMKNQLEIKKNIHRLCSGFVLDLYKRKVVKIPLAEKGF